MLQVMQGVSIAFYTRTADVLLMLLLGSIPDSFQAYALGYDARPGYVPTRAIGLHHPDGDVMHMSVAEGPNGILTAFTAWRFPGERTSLLMPHISGVLRMNVATVHIDFTYHVLPLRQPLASGSMYASLHPVQSTSTKYNYEVTWTKGVTTAGSSGSPLIDADTGRVVGVLTGGPSSCAQVGTGGAADYYGRLSVAYGLGLERYLSDRPEDGSSLSQQLWAYSLNQGAVITNLQVGRDVPYHGPGLNYIPTHLPLSLDNRQANFTYYLTDPPRGDEVISMSYALHGMVPGNVADAADFLEFDPGVTNFTLNDFHKFPRFFIVRLQDNVTEIPGGLVRFLFTVNLTTSSNTSYLHINFLSGTIQNRNIPWWGQEATVTCPSLPCGFSADDLAAHTQKLQGNGKAIFGMNNTGNLPAFKMTVAVEPDAFLTTTLTAYCNNHLIWSAHPTELDFLSEYSITELYPQQNARCIVMLHDFRNMDAPLPLSLIKGIQLTPVGPAETLQLGPVEGDAASLPPSEGEPHQLYGKIPYMANLADPPLQYGAGASAVPPAEQPAYAPTWQRSTR
eukprot:jgi/Botrbrau1/18725/Bobra.0386s0048.1